MNDTLADILDRVQRGELDTDEAERLIRQRSAASLGFATVDLDRAHRCGFAEVIFARGKMPEQVAAIARTLRQRSGGSVLITRAEPAHLEALQTAFTDVPLQIGQRSGAVVIDPPTAIAQNDGDAAPIAIVTAGTSDEPVAEEAELTCLAFGRPAVRINDVGVAGLHRLSGHLPLLRRAEVVICIAGMEGALPSVVGGLVDVPVIAVPTSVGYGASFGGVAALLGMLNSCASGVSVVNIDNGFGAAYSACLIHRLAERRRAEVPDTAEVRHG